ncbi:DUF4956 domain-containing protein [Aliikangiella sp. G2MR2-5]|uniref:DUF4956 domain-containing protein n=1 Tax=Aliikangiella sp. G2MR2-5 TaxID=2788943 RepID=UPI0018A8E9A1|nr:DUF4956 domain-containing protein [Aliikangiella sp. G2MR2-5]
MNTLTHDFLLRFAINLIFSFILSFFCYYRTSRNRQIASSLVLFGIGIFIITNLLHRADISMGFAFGLFAIFTMLRYRTEPISIKEMTYLFIIISIALLTAVGQATIAEIALVNSLLCLAAFLLDSKIIQGSAKKQSIKYEKIENIRPDRRSFLFADLQARTGLEIKEVKIEQIDFLRDTALLTIEYLPRSQKINKNSTSLSEEKEVLS